MRLGGFFSKEIVGQVLIVSLARWENMSES
jgi:hypothetical protein